MKTLLAVLLFVTGMPAAVPAKPVAINIKLMDATFVKSSKTLVTTGGTITWCSTSAITAGSYTASITELGLTAAFSTTINASTSNKPNCTISLSLAVPAGLRRGPIYTLKGFGTYAPFLGNPTFSVK